MKKHTLLMLLIAGSMLALQSCKVEKRVHRPGYHVEWKKSKPNKTQKVNQDKEELLQAENEQKKPETKSTPQTKSAKKEVSDNFTAAHHSPAERLGNLEVLSFAEPITDYQTGIQDNMAEYFDDECDTLFMRNGTEVLAIVIEINPVQIKYKRCDYQQGPLITVFKRDVARVVYPNGVVEEFEDEAYHRPYFKEKAEVEEPEKPVVESVSVFSMIAGIVGLVFSALPFTGLAGPGLVLGALAILFGIIAVSIVSSNPHLYIGKGIAATGLFLGILNLTLTLLVFRG